MSRLSYITKTLHVPFRVKEEAKAFAEVVDGELVSINDFDSVNLRTIASIFSLPYIVKVDDCLSVIQNFSIYGGRHSPVKMTLEWLDTAFSIGFYDRTPIEWVSQNLTKVFYIKNFNEEENTFSIGRSKNKIFKCSNEPLYYPTDTLFQYPAEN